MKFHIEITRDTAGVSTKVIYRTIVDEMSPERAKTKAGALLNLYDRERRQWRTCLGPEEQRTFQIVGRAPRPPFYPV
jgi:hypothetical protein